MTSGLRQPDKSLYVVPTVPQEHTIYEKVYGWRYFRWGEASHPNKDQYVPGVLIGGGYGQVWEGPSLVAECKKSVASGDRSGYVPHKAPYLKDVDGPENCNCGIHVYTSFERMYRNRGNYSHGDDNFLVASLIVCSGKVVTRTSGLRVEKARIERLFCDTMDEDYAKAVLERYGVAVEPTDALDNYESEDRSTWAPQLDEITIDLTDATVMPLREILGGENE